MFVSNIKSEFNFWKLLKFRYNETYGTIASENLEYSLTNSLLW